MIGREPGAVCTFYSYKGGVGRSLALANVAVLLAQWGFGVLCIDWDLEAPGLHLYFEPYLATPPGDGVVELVTALASEQEAPWQHRVAGVAIPGAAGRLDLMPAGRLDEDYIARLQALDWAALYADRGLGPALERVRDEWTRAYDLVLIDSRTGITDIGGICTVQLPDILVVALTANRQNLDGALDVLRRADANRSALPVERDRLRALPLVTRFEGQTEVDLAREWTRIFEEALAPVVRVWSHKDVAAGDVLNHTRVPSVPHWSFGERLPAMEEGTRDPLSVGYAFETVAAMLARGLERMELLVANRESYVDGARSRGADLAGGGEIGRLDAYIACRPDDAEAAASLLEALRAYDIRAVVHTAHVQPNRQARCLVVLVGPHGAPDESAYQTFLLQAATNEAARPVFPVLIGDAVERLLPQALRPFKRLGIDSPRHADHLAADLLTTRLDALERALGRDHEQTLRTADRLAEAIAAYGDTAGAAAILRETVPRRTRLLGPDAPDTVAATMRLADVLAQGGDTEPARALYARLVETLEGTRGNDDPDAVVARRRLVTLSEEPRPLDDGLVATFVDRHGELELFARMIAGESAAPRVLVLTAPSGTGKTALLQRFLHMCRTAVPPVPVAPVAVGKGGVTSVTPVGGRAVSTVDGFVEQAAGELFRGGLVLPVYDSVQAARILGGDRRQGSLLDAFPRDVAAHVRDGGRAVLLVDDYDAAPDELRNWIWSRFAASPDGPVVVLAGSGPARHLRGPHVAVQEGLSDFSAADIVELGRRYGIQLEPDVVATLTKLRTPKRIISVISALGDEAFG